MPRSTEEWRGRTPDSKIPDRVRVRVFDRHNGICHISKRKITPADVWQVDHIKPLIQGGEHRESNLAPALSDPHKQKTRQEVREKSKVASIRKKHLGIKSNTKKIESRGFGLSEHKAKREASQKTALPPRRLYQEIAE